MFVWWDIVKLKNIETWLAFIYGLYNNPVSHSDYMMLNDRVINEVERMWKEVVMA
jgi:hypothetical protein